MRIIILGSGSFAREVYDWVQQTGHEVVGFFSGVTDRSKNELRSLPIYYPGDTIPENVQWIIGSGNTKAMKDMIQKISIQNVPAAPAIIHNSCIVGSNVQVGNGSIICPGCILTCDI